MKKFLLITLSLVFLDGCTRDSHDSAASHRATDSTRANPQGTDVGTSYPGVNQPTTTTTASRSNAGGPQ